jgi:O-antigen/teichoic acid export membrane protein
VAGGHDYAELRRFVLVAFAATGSLSVAVYGLILMPAIPALNLQGNAKPLVLLILPPLLMLDWTSYFFQGSGRPRAYALTRSMPAVLTLVFLALAAIRGLTLFGAILAFGLGAWLVALVAAASAWRSLGEKIPAGAGIHLVRFALRTHPGTLAGVANARLDVLFLSLLVPLAALGNYSVAVSATGPIAVAGASVGAAYYRTVAGRDRQGGVNQAWRRFLAPTALLTAVAAALAAALPFVLGIQYSSAVKPMIILALGTGGLGAIYLGTSMLQAMHNPGRSSLIFASAAVLSAGTLVVLVPSFGIVGGAASSAFTYMLVGILAYEMSRRSARR